MTAPNHPPSPIPPEDKVVSMWRGKRLDEYSKKELIEIVIEVGRQLHEESHEHARQLDVIGGMIRNRK